MGLQIVLAEAIGCWVQHHNSLPAAGVLLCTTLTLSPACLVLCARALLLQSRTSPS